MSSDPSLTIPLPCGNMNEVNSHCHKSAGIFYLARSILPLAFFNRDSSQNNQPAGLIENALLQLLRRGGLYRRRWGGLRLRRGRRRWGHHDGRGRRGPRSRTGTTRSPNHYQEQTRQESNFFSHYSNPRLEVVGQATKDHELVQLCVNIDILG